MELLAPAGNLENLKIAISNGANAVYLGLQSFNARSKADNFTIDNIKSVVDYCHLRGVKVYVTANTLVKNDEFNEFLTMVKACIEAKVDAYIVQDLGVAYFLKNTFKNIVLHASTQMGVHNLKGALVLEKFGFSRVVLSRETKLKDIEEIAQNTSLEIEYFVQGALCVAFSGACYFSSLMHRESGNRGRCLQLCRLKYRSYLADRLVKEGYLLSPTDLCLINSLEKLQKAGVCSLKIEGRLRRAGYVAAVTKEYRNALDKFEIDCNSFNKTFYRGDYNKGEYLQKASPNIINPEFQNHRGVEIGVVKEVKPFKNLYEITLTSTHDIKQNDGLKFVNAKGEVSLGVGSVKKLGENIYSLITTAKPNKNDKVYLTVDKAWEDNITQIYDKLKIDVSFLGRAGSEGLLTFSYKDVCVTEKTEEVLQSALSSPMTEDSLRQSLSKLGESDFELKRFSCDIDNIFISKGNLNALRRKAAEALKNKILEDYNLNNIKDIQAGAVVDSKTTIRPFRAEVINEETKEFSCENIIISPLDYNNIEKIAALVEKVKGKAYLNLPIVANSDDLKIVDNLLGKVSFAGVVANNIYGLSYNSKEIVAGIGLNIVNSFAINFLNVLGINKCIRSVEGYLAKTLGGGSVYVGNIPLMTLCHCPYKVNFGNDCSKCTFTKGLTYKQERGKEFEIRRYRLSQCYFELLGKSLDKEGEIIDLR